MTKNHNQSQPAESDGMKINVSKNGPYLVEGGVPLIREELCNDNEGYCRKWKEVTRYPIEEKYAICRCGHSMNKPFCDGSHAEY